MLSAMIHAEQFRRTLYFFFASFGSPSKLSLPSLPTLLKSAPPASLTPLPLVAAPSNPVSETSLLGGGSSSCRLAALALTVSAFAEFQSEATGGSSGSGRLATRSSIISALLFAPDIL